MANDPNTIQYVIQEDGFWYIASKEKNPYVPELTVSAKGVANGLSTEYNDGWDFGPDSYDPTSTSAIPYTRTAGIQEAVNYLVSKGGGKIKINAGYYLISPDATFSYVGQVYNQVVGSGVDVYALFNLNSSSIVSIEIEGVKTILSSGGSGATFPSNSNGVIIDISNISLPSTTATYVVFGAINRTTVANPVHISGINVIASTPIQFGHTIIANSTSSSIEYCSLVPTPQDSDFITGTPANNPYQISFKISGQAGGASWANMLYAQQVYTAFLLGAHATAGTLISQSNIIGIIPDTGYIGDILHFDVQGTKYPVYNNVSTGSQGTLHIFGWQEEDYSAVADTSFPTTYDVYDVNNNLTLIVDFAVMNRNGSSNNVPPKIYGLNNKIIKAFGMISTTDLYPTITTPSVPASGTAQQNTNPYTVKAYIQGGAITEIQITIGSNTYTVYSNSTASAVYEGFTLPAGASITLTYSTAPTWEWVPE